MNHAKTPDYLNAIANALQEIKNGHAISYCTGRSYSTGRYVELLTDQGWSPEYFWREYEDEPYMGANDTTPD
jgi:hypothetical protein